MFKKLYSHGQKAVKKNNPSVYQTKGLIADIMNQGSSKDIETHTTIPLDHTSNHNVNRPPLSHTKDLQQTMFKKLYSPKAPMSESSLQDAHIKNVLKDSTQPLTFGVELEFLIAGLDAQYQDTTPEDPRNVSKGPISSCQPENGERENQALYNEIAAILSEEGLQAEAVNFYDQNWKAENSASWVVGSDASLVGPSIQDPKDPLFNFHFHSVEICSPIFLFNAKSLVEVTKLCNILERKFRVLVNNSCGLHVHIGDGMNGFPVYTLRKLMATLFTFEDTIEMMHPPHRRNSKKLFGMAPGLRNFSALSIMLPQPKNEVEYSNRALEAIFGAESVKELWELVSYRHRDVAHHTRMAYNLHNLLKNEPGKPQIQSDDLCGLIGVPGSKRTIEFRQHAGTIDPIAVRKWISFCANIVRFAGGVDEDVLKLFLARYVNHAGCEMKLGIGELLMTLGMEDIAGYDGESEDLDDWEEV